MNGVRILSLGLALVAASGAVEAQQTLDLVKKRGQMICGVSTGTPGFSNPDAQGNWSGFDVDLCRATVAAVFADVSKIKYVPTTAQTRFTALQSGEIDMLSRTSTWTMTRDVQLGLEFVAVGFYDGQGFMVPKKSGIKSALELKGAAVCTASGTTTEMNLADYFRTNKMDYKVVAYEKVDEVNGAYDSGRCDAYTTDRSSLAAQRTKLKVPDDHVILPEVISKEPLGPVVRHGDNNWADIVRWSYYTMVIAEELGVSSANVDEMKKSANPEIKRLLGIEGDFGKQLGLDNAWAYNIIKLVGNYAESYERNLGPKTPIGLPRGVNDLWTKGGLQYAPPIR